MARKDYIVGSGNVFEDLGHRRPAEALAKAELARKIAALVAERRLTQASATELQMIDQRKCRLWFGAIGDGSRASADRLRSCPKFAYRFRTAFTHGSPAKASKCSIRNRLCGGGIHATVIK